MSEALHFFKALADETRVRLLHVLSHYELNVNELVHILEMGQSRTSRHLKILSSSGLLTWRREGLWVFYSVPQDGPGRAFIDAVLPFIRKDPLLASDMDMAASMIEERARSTRQFFNSIAEDWDTLSREILGGFDLAGAVVECMPPCRVAADLGCGTGNVLLAMLAKAHMVIGVDGSPRMLELARRRFSRDSERVSLRIGDLAHLPLADAEADFISLNMVLHHLPAPGDVLAEIRRTLAPQGVLVITDFNRHEDERMRSDYGDRWLGFEETTLRTYLERAGLCALSFRLVPLCNGLSLHIVRAAVAAHT